MSIKSLKKVMFAAVAAICAATAFAAKPYDAEVEYLDANATSGTTMYIDTGLYPSDTMGARVCFANKSNSGTGLFGTWSSTGNRWYFGGSPYYVGWNGITASASRYSGTTNVQYEIYFNYMNDRRNRITQDGNVVHEFANSPAWGGGDSSSILLFSLRKQDGTTYYKGNFFRIWSARFTDGNRIVQDLIPVRKDGVGYMFDKVTGTLLSNTKPSGAPDFVYGNDVADESYIEGTITLNADANWTSRGILRLDSSAVIDLNGHSLTIAGAFGDGTITDSSRGAPGTLRISSPLNMEEPFTATTSGNLTVLRSHKPYDAQVEYLEAPSNSGGKVPYIDTGLYPGDNKGVLLRVMPLRTSDSTVCGVQCYSAADKKQFKWYFGFNYNKEARIYLSWGDTPANDDAHRPQFSANKTYDILFNHLNDRNRRVVGVDNATDFSLAIDETWPNTAATNTIYLFAFNNNGSAVGNTGNARIYSAQFTQGGNVVMDLIPVRKNGEGYMYDKVSEKLLAKVPTAPLDFTYVNDATDEAYIEGTVTLDADTDWTSRGILSIDPSATIDLNGHSLTIEGAYGTGTITNSSENVGEVHFVVPERMEQTSNIRLLGNLKVVKEGAGALSLSRTGQTFTGGVVVSAGVANATADESNRCWGADGGTIRVSSGATFSVNGKNDFYLKDFILAGGTISNNVAMTGNGLGNITLEADSSIITAGEYKHIIFSSPDNNRTISLGGHTLAVSLEYGTQFQLDEPAVNGTLVFDKQTSGRTGGWLRVDSGESGGSPTLNIEMDTAAFRLYGEFSVSNYVARYDDIYNQGDYAIKVYGTFTPAAVLENGTERFHGCEMQDGSTIDLSAKSATWGNVATGWSGTSADDDGNRTVTFATNATVTIDVHGRELAKGAKIVAWDAVPENLATLTFKFDDETVPLLVTGDGIYYNVTEAEVETAHWTGAAGDGDVTNPANWACTNYTGTAVADGLPLGSSEVHVSGDVAFDITPAKPLAYNTLMLDSVRLTNDCDWSGLVLAKVGDDGDTVNLGSVELNGYKLRLAAPQIADALYDFVSLSITDTSVGDSGELHLDVPLADSQLICTGLALSGNVKLVKDGLGGLAMTRANQTFIGGVLIAEGKGYLPGQDFSETNLCWGPVGGTITIVTNATFDASGNNDFYLKNFVLDGGTLANTTPMNIDAGSYGFGNVTLVADSYFNMRNTTFLNPLDPATKVDLGGHVLEVALGAKSGANLYMPVSVENGSMTIVSGGYLALTPGTSGGSSSINLEMTGATFKTDGDFSVSNYVARYTENYNHGTQPLIVYGTFTPAAVSGGKEYFHGCVMQDGSCIDLSAKTAVWSNVSTGWSGTGNADGSRTITFADNATVTIDVHGRELAKGDLVVEWGAVPANLATLVFVSDAATDKPLTATEVGIYYDLTANEAATAHWTGAANDKDVTNPANWACTNFFGGEVVNGLPIVSTKVYVSGDVALDITAEKPLAFESLTFSSARLTRDCDWSGLEWAITANSGDTVNLGSIDLNGHKLRLATPSSASTFYDCISLAVSDGSAGDPGELHLEVPSASAKLICTGLALSSNVKLVKDGLGWLTMMRADQSFTGGVLVAEGTAASNSGSVDSTTYSEKYGYWGPSNGVITVAAGGKFDIRGNYDFYCKNFILAGGALASTGVNQTKTGWQGIGNVTLAEDSRIDTVQSVSALFSAKDFVGAKIDLAGHTLTITNSLSANLYMHLPIVNGTIDTVGSSGGYIHVVAGSTGGSPTVNLNMGCAFNTAGEFSVSNYTARYTQKWNHGAQPLIVYGTFTPAAVDANGKDYFHGCVMQDGSSIDLSGKTNAWSVVSTGWSGSGDADGSRTITFADNATVTVNLGTRRVRTLEKVVDWSSAVPENLEGLTFYGVVNGGWVKLKVLPDGLYMPKRGLTIIVR